MCFGYTCYCFILIRTIPYLFVDSIMATNTTYASHTFSNNSFFDDVFAARADQEIRIVIAGKTGEGKRLFD